jgi:hypothetical protein
VVGDLQPGRVLALHGIERVADRVADQEFGTAVVADIDVPPDHAPDALGRAQRRVAQDRDGRVDEVRHEPSTMAYSTSCLLAKWWYMVEENKPTASAMSRIEVAP